MIHTPTGITETRQGRKRETNLRDAKKAILERLKDSGDDQTNRSVAIIRKDQIGSGMRGDKIRTYRFQDNRVTDHRTGRKTTCSKALKGHFDALWD